MEGERGAVKHKHHGHAHHHHAHHHPSAHRHHHHHHHHHHKGSGHHEMSDSEIEEGYSESSEEDEEEEEEMIPLDDGMDEDEFSEMHSKKRAVQERGDGDGKHKGHAGYRTGVHHRMDEELESEELQKHVHMIHAHGGSSELGDEDEVSKLGD